MPEEAAEGLYRACLDAGVSLVGPPPLVDWQAPQPMAMAMDSSFHVSQAPPLVDRQAPQHRFQRLDAGRGPGGPAGPVGGVRSGGGSREAPHDSPKEPGLTRLLAEPGGPAGIELGSQAAR